MGGKRAWCGPFLAARPAPRRYAIALPGRLRIRQVTEWLVAARGVALAARRLAALALRSRSTTLMRRWEWARQGDGQLVLIVGEPGLGKSRLIEEFHVRLRETPHTWVEWGCSQLLQNTPLHPITEWGRQPGLPSLGNMRLSSGNSAQR